MEPPVGYGGRIGLAEAGFTALMEVKTGTFSYGPKGYSG
jgi:hypothetical protein